MGCRGKHTISRTLTILVAMVALAGCSSMSRLLGDAPPAEHIEHSRTPGRAEALRVLGILENTIHRAR